jgi:hypothetical protein
MKISGCKPGQMQVGKYCIPKWCKTFFDHYGVTSSITDRGFILPDGSIMDFHKLSHTDVARATGVGRENRMSQYGIMYEFMRQCDCVKYFLDDFGELPFNVLAVEAYTKPNPEQKEILRLLLPKAKHFDAQSRKGRGCSISVKDPTIRDIDRWMGRCW